MNSLPKNENMLKSYTQISQDLDLEKSDGFGEILLYITCSPKDPLQWMGAVKKRDKAVEKHHNNPHNGSLSVNILWSENMCLKETSIIKAF